MHDFSCKKADDMKNAVLAKKIRYFKEDEKRVSKMCKIMENFVAEEVLERNTEKALKMLEQKRIQEYELEDFYGFTPEQAERVLEIYHKKISVNEG